jgi:hypothetical protein
MSWTSNLLRKYLGDEEHETFEQCLARLRHSGSVAATPLAEQVALLEEELARALLLIHTLAEACVEKGLFTREEIAETAAEIDLWDGVADGKLDPKAVLPKPPPAPAPKPRKPPRKRG